MALANSYTTQPAAVEAPVAQPETNSYGSEAAALLLMGALAGTAMTKAGRKQMRAVRRKLLWTALGAKLKSMFGKKHLGDTIAGMDSWLFILLVVAAAALGVALFGLWGFIVILALGAIIYLLLKQST